MPVHARAPRIAAQLPSLARPMNRSTKGSERAKRGPDQTTEGEITKDSRRASHRQFGRWRADRFEPYGFHGSDLPEMIPGEKG